MKKISGTLYLIPTPIGNLEDISFRAVRLLKEVALIGAEDTRQSKILLSHYDIKTSLISYHKFNEKQRLEKLIALLKEGKDIAIISDSGSPGISDPSSLIVQEAIAENITVSALPGASAFIPALTASGLDTSSFSFIGFLPSKNKDKKLLLSYLKNEKATMLFYEAPHRLFAFLEDLHHSFGNREIVIAREISKIYETYYRNNIEYFLNHKDEIVLKGEFVVVCEGCTPKETSDEDIIKKLKELIEGGYSKSAATAEVSKILNISKNRVYSLALQL